MCFPHYRPDRWAGLIDPETIAKLDGMCDLEELRPPPPPPSPRNYLRLVPAIEVSRQRGINPRYSEG